MSFSKTLNFKIKSKILPGLTFVLSWLIVAYGQPAWSCTLGVISSVIGYTLFWVALNYFEGKKERFVISCLWFMAVEAIHLSWMTSSKFQGYYIYAVYLFVLTAMSVQFGLLNAFFKKGEDLTLRKSLALSGFWVWMEYLRLFFICGFPFNPAGLALASTKFGMQSASITGIYGLTFWVIFTNFLGYRFFYKRSIKRGLFFLACALVPYLFGLGHISYHQRKINASKESPLRAILVQTALNPIEKTGLRGYEKMVPPIDQWASIYEYLSKYQDQRVDTIILPERTVPFSHNELFYEHDSVKKLVRFYFGEKGSKALPKLKKEAFYVDNVYLSQTLANIFNAKVIVGLEYVKNEGPNFFEGNASAFCFSKGRPYEMYHKRVLLPLVEYLPFEWCKRLAKRYNIFGWYERGDKPVVFEGNLKIAPSICMEEMYSYIIRQNRKEGGKVFVNITNDVWYPNSKLPKQHFDHGILRAVENGVPLLRACNTGITCGVDSLGRTVGMLKEGGGSFEWSKGALYVEVPRYHYPTLYTFWGDFLILSTSLTFILTGLFAYFTLFLERKALPQPLTCK